MRLLLCSLSAAGAIAVGGAAAYAADLDARPMYNPPAAYSWTGFYLGGNGGFGGDKFQYPFTIGGPVPTVASPRRAHGLRGGVRRHGKGEYSHGRAAVIQE
jgi:outer membrane immunogenic protein